MSGAFLVVVGLLPRHININERCTDMTGVNICRCDLHDVTSICVYTLHLLRVFLRVYLDDLKPLEYVEETS